MKSYTSWEWQPSLYPFCNWIFFSTTFTHTHSHTQTHKRPGENRRAYIHPFQKRPVHWILPSLSGLIPVERESRLFSEACFCAGACCHWPALALICIQSTGRQQRHRQQLQRTRELWVWHMKGKMKADCHRRHTGPNDAAEIEVNTSKSIKRLPLSKDDSLLWLRLCVCLCVCVRLCGWRA